MTLPTALAWALPTTLLFSSAAIAQDSTPPPPAKENDGTDPTQLSTAADVAFEHVDIRGGLSGDSLALGLTIPFGGDKRTAVRVRVPFASNDVLGDGSFDLGDASLKLTRVLTVTRSYGMVASGELVFNSASRPELGSGKTVLKGSFIYAKFLKGGNIFAPAVVHSQSIAGNSSRGRVSNTTLDFYFVPRLSNRKLLMTIDPALTHDWENEATFASLGVTFGIKLGKFLGGNSQISVKPTIFAGKERSANWSTQLTFKVLNF